MTDRIEHSDIRSEQLAEILKLGGELDSEDGALEVCQDKADLLHGILTNRLPLESAMEKSLPRLLQQVTRELKSLAGETIGHLLRAPDTDLATLKSIKDYGKQLANRTSSELEHDAATTIYFAAIAYALLHHDRKITTYAYAKLSDSFMTLGKEEWIEPELTELFKRAAAVCLEKKV